MRTSRVYYKDSLTVGSSIILNTDSAHYLGNVLRLKEGNEVILFNEDAGDVIGTITSITKQELSIKLNEKITTPLVSDLYIHLGLVISKGDRMDYGIQKSTELGVNEITPLFSEFCEVKFTESRRQQKKIGHWQRIAISACEQSGAHIPLQINNPTKIVSFVQRKVSSTRLILDVQASKNITEIGQADAFEILIGPEGGFSNQELKIAKNHGYQPVNLGPRILRTETAPVAATAILQSKFGNW